MVKYSPEQNHRAGAIASRIEVWFADHARPLPWRRDYEPWHVLVAEVMAQQTRMGVVVDYFGRFIERFPDPGALARADEEEVLSLWSGLGYYSRARNLQAAAVRIVELHGGEVPRSFDELLALPGVGKYTAGAVASIAFDQRVPVVDGNVARVFARIACVDAPWRSSKLISEAESWAAALVEVADSPRLLNQGMMELGSSVCRPTTPLCASCCISIECRAFAEGRQAQFPVPAIKRETVRIRVPLLMIEDASCRLLTITPSSGSLLRGMIHLPHGNDELIDEAEIHGWISKELVGSFRHSITNRRIVFDVHRAELTSDLVRESANGEMIEVEDLYRLPIPSYVRKALDIYRSVRGES